MQAFTIGSPKKRYCKEKTDKKNYKKTQKSCLPANRSHCVDQDFGTQAHLSNRLRLLQVRLEQVHLELLYTCVGKSLKVKDHHQLRGQKSGQLINITAPVREQGPTDYVQFYTEDKYNFTERRGQKCTLRQSSGHARARQLRLME